MSSSNGHVEALEESHGCTVWFTGLSGAGKSTLARGLAEQLRRLDLDYELLDGDELRKDLCRDLGFEKSDRDENVRRIGFIARLLNRHRVIAVVAAISPYRHARLEARQNNHRFLEVHVDCRLEILIQRDAKGLYNRAIAGEIPHFSGISDPYEAPLVPDLYLNTENQSPKECLMTLVAKLEELDWLPKRHRRLLPSFQSPASGLVGSPS
jgi:adenylyl-sulfate kinase